ncbi:MAG: deoxyribonuclease V [Ktedonobacterales bacterium]|nr:deoxyribonuclease V [Ktedonobacterales bacterium]
MHSWDVSEAEAIAIQQELRGQVQRGGPLTLADVRTVAGIDASYKEIGQAAVVVLSFPDMTVVEQVTATRSSVFPYVPGLLSFREGPAVLDAMAKLTTQPDVLIFDGQGIAHPRRLGIAAHMGVVLGQPSIGCAKSRLVGKYAEPGPNAGDQSPLYDRGEQIGVVLRSKPRTNPLFISTGHLIDLDVAMAILLRCFRGYRLPEPTRQADKLAAL